MSRILFWKSNKSFLHGFVESLLFPAPDLGSVKLKLIIYCRGTLQRRESQQEPQPTENREALQHVVSSAKMNQMLSDAAV